jgi:signal transduction histidine kinase
LSNAVKFTPKGKGIDIFIKFSDISFELNKTESKKIPAVSLHVKDQGMGIPPDELNSVFDKFVQSSKTSPQMGGTGLGLAICKEIIIAHKGKIWAENNTDIGSMFSFILPLDKG